MFVERHRTSRFRMNRTRSFTLLSSYLTAERCARVMSSSSLFCAPLLEPQTVEQLKQVPHRSNKRRKAPTQGKKVNAHRSA